MSESGGLEKFLGGLVIGVVATFIYVRFGVGLPGALGVSQRVTSAAMVKTAEMDLYNEKAHPVVRRRALAVVLANKPDLFIEIDAALGNQFFNEFMRRHMEDQPGYMEGQPDTISPSSVGTAILIESEEPVSR